MRYTVRNGLSPFNKAAKTCIQVHNTKQYVLTLCNNYMLTLAKCIEYFCARPILIAETAVPTRQYMVPPQSLEHGC